MKYMDILLKHDEIEPIRVVIVSLNHVLDILLFQIITPLDTGPKSGVPASFGAGKEEGWARG